MLWWLQCSLTTQLQSYIHFLLLIQFRIARELEPVPTIFKPKNTVSQYPLPGTVAPSYSGAVSLPVLLVLPVHVVLTNNQNFWIIFLLFKHKYLTTIFKAWRNYAQYGKKWRHPSMLKHILAFVGCCTHNFYLDIPFNSGHPESHVSSSDSKVLNLWRSWHFSHCTCPSLKAGPGLLGQRPAASSPSEGEVYIIYRYI